MGADMSDDEANQFMRDFGDWAKWSDARAMVQAAYGLGYSMGRQVTPEKAISAWNRRPAATDALQIVEAEISRAEALLNVEDGGEPMFDRAQTEAGIAALRTVAAAIETCSRKSPA